MRTFIAFDITDRTRSELGRAQRNMGRIAGVRWVRPAGIHLTVKFVGDVVDQAILEIFEVMRRAVTGVKPVEFTVRGLGWFPPGRRPRVLWAGVDCEGDILAAIARRLDEGLADLGVRPENRAFKPHITLGRVRGALDAGAAEDAFRRVGQREFGRNVARELVLYMSELHPGGAHYTRMGAVGLGEDKSP